MRRKDHPAHAASVIRATSRDRLRLAICGCRSDGIPSVAERLAKFEGWLDSGALILRFESLVGVAGGAEDAVQLASLAELYAYLGFEQAEGLAMSVQSKLFSQLGPTFRHRQIRGWESELDERLQARLDQVAGPMLRRYGY